MSSDVSGDGSLLEYAGL